MRLEVSRMQNIENISDVIVGRVSPKIYAFSTAAIPNYLKVGDTYRPVATRLKEWRHKYSDLVQQYEGEATINDDIFFRDFSVHDYIEKDKHRTRLQSRQLNPGIHYSREFFQGAQTQDLDQAIADIQRDYNSKGGRYEFYDAVSHLPQPFTYERDKTWILRPNQQEAVNKFKQRVQEGRTKLLMYAVMRFGKSFTSLSCAQSIHAKTILVVSAKADVKEEWKKTVECPKNFEGWDFVDSQALILDEKIVTKIHQNNHTAVIFLTLQDLQGSEIKDKHREVFAQSIDMLIIDETHFGARGKEFGQILRNASQPVDPTSSQKLDYDDLVEHQTAENEIKRLHAKVRLHLSGTPYRILMSNEFQQEDIISFVQFSDIVHDQQQWDFDHLDDEAVNEWDNPYFGFPQMVRFAFNPNASSRKKIEEFHNHGISCTLSALLEPKCVKLDTKQHRNREFKFKSEISDLLNIIDGSQQDENILGFLDYDKIKKGKMCRHIVMVLPYCASCDAMEKLIDEQRATFKNLGEYKIINISGVEGSQAYRQTEDVKRAISEAEKNNQKTLTLTVNRMLTGSTVEQWDTMIYLKDTSSPQEYDQAIFRLQNQYIRELVSSNGDIIRQNLKPQTLLVDFDPARMFRLQEQKSLIYNINSENVGNDKLETRLRKDLEISPIITMNSNKILKVEATDILKAVSDYNSRRSISDEARDIPVDLGLLSNTDILGVVQSQAEMGTNEGLALIPYEGEETDLDIEGDHEDVQGSSSQESEEGNASATNDGTMPEDESSLKKKLQTYYQRILCYAMLSQTYVNSLQQIVDCIGQEDNARIAHNIGLQKEILQQCLDIFDPFKLRALDYKIQNISQLCHDDHLTPLERSIRALGKFNRISDSEVRTPTDLCHKMVKAIPFDKLATLIDRGEKILDISSKSAEFAVALYKLFVEDHHRDSSLIKDSIFSVPTSSIAYEFTRRFYEILGLNCANIAAAFDSYDLLEVKNSDSNVDYDKISQLLTQNRVFNIIRLDDNPEGANSVKFGAVVGNPPYQELNKGTSARQLYPYFMDAAYKIAPIACLVTPARFVWGAGKNNDNWSRKILNDRHIEVSQYWSDASLVFPDIDLKGGIIVTLRDASRLTDKLGPWSIYPQLKGILDKVTSHENGNYRSLKETVQLQLKFNLDALYEDYPQYKSIIGSKGNERRLTTNIFERLPNLFTQERHEEDIQILGLLNKKRTIRYVNKRYINHSKSIDTWKVVLPKTSGSGKFGEALTNPEILGPFSGFTQSFISIGSFEHKDEAKAALTYIKTKFARALLSTKKATQDNNSEVWVAVPLQDFSSDSEIDWNAPIQNIDLQLFRNYHFTKKEKEFVLSHVDPMS